MNYESLLELIKKRRSIRRFKPDPIPDEYVDKIIEAARWAPSGANSQPWEFIVVKKEELRKRIIEPVMEYTNLVHKAELTREPRLRLEWRGPPGFVRAPVFILLCGDVRTKDAYPLLITLQRGSSHFASSLANAFLYMTLVATTLGLGSQWVSATTTPYVQSIIKDLLKIPKELEIYDMLAVGYPDFEPKPRLVRAKEEMIHYDYYDEGKSRTDEKVNDFIAQLRG